MPEGLEEQLTNVVFMATKQAMEQHQKVLFANDWMSIKEGASYAGVSVNTFSKFREMGLKVCEIDGVKRVSRKEINEFLESNSQ
jgi:hypothetical protein